MGAHDKQPESGPGAGQGTARRSRACTSSHNPLGRMLKRSGRGVRTTRAGAYREGPKGGGVPLGSEPGAGAGHATTPLSGDRNLEKRRGRNYPRQAPPREDPQGSPGRAGGCRGPPGCPIQCRACASASRRKTPRTPRHPGQTVAQVRRGSWAVGSGRQNPGQLPRTPRTTAAAEVRRSPAGLGRDVRRPRLRPRLQGDGRRP
jgi:hypothetical protein